MILLIILDGWGISENKHGNAILKARTPNFDSLLSHYPHTSLRASGEDVGLREGFPGNSEVGHLNIGAGRVVYQDSTRIDRAIRDGSFFGNPELLKAIKNVKEKSSKLHLVGLLSDGGIHSHIAHLFALLKLAEAHDVETVIHPFLDGRDVLPKSFPMYLNQLKDIVSGNIGTIMGRYYAMDRDNRWDRTKRAYEALTGVKGLVAESVEEAVQASYEQGETDEYVQPTIIGDTIKNGDSVIFFNFRPDRAIQLTRAFVDEPFEHFDRKKLNIYFVCMTEYGEDITTPSVFSLFSLRNTLGEVLSNHNLRQLRIAETEKYYHVTFFFNGGEEEPFKGEDRILIPSPRVDTYDSRPEMSAYEITKRVIEEIHSQEYDIIIMNFANPDMVGHTGALKAGIKAIEAVDECLGLIVEACNIDSSENIILITGDHGNAEQMTELNSDRPYTSHTSNPVPFIITKRYAIRSGTLADVAPTILDLLGIEKPKEMDGESLIRVDSTTLLANLTNYLSRLSTELEIGDAVRQNAAEILQEAVKYQLFFGKGSAAIAAGSLYVASILGDESEIQEDVRNRMLSRNDREAKEFLDAVDILLPRHLGYKARSLIARQKYSDARPLLEKIIELSSEFKKSLQEEFGFLYNFAENIEKDESQWNRNKKLIDLRENLWFILSERNNFSLESISLPLEPQRDKKKPEISKDSTHLPKKTAEKSYVRGEALEKAVLRLFRQFFIIAEEDEKAILHKLRKQKKGLQFGHDISFECTVRGNGNVRCHIECKNKEGTITLKDIADKLASTKAYCSDIDHWVLISPRSNPSSELDNLLSLWHDRREYPFEVQVWCPDTDVEEFFGLCPAVYNLFYETKEDGVHPSQWSEEKQREVFDKWKQRLSPLIRLPKEWEEYLREPFRMRLKNEKTIGLETLYQHHVSMGCMDERKNIIGQSLRQHILDWLEDKETPVMFLLGEFGDGKTVLTYILSRHLAANYIENPSNGWIPVRFALRDYYVAENGQEFLRKRLVEIGSNIATWNRVRERNKTLVILDGFDEMTKRLDSRTITKNIRELIECCKEFEGSKILITSRTHFFENQRNVKRLLQRLPTNCTCYLAPIDRSTNIKHLEEYAKTEDLKRKLRSICRLHDPIGLAQKPLFLQMIKETLHKLPEENLDEITLYETYIKESLYRKIENLDDIEMATLPGEIYSNLVKILEQIALKLQGST